MCIRDSPRADRRGSGEKDHRRVLKGIMTKELDLTFTKVMTDWYAENKRDLPWRIDKNPYHVWVSEIMLQQTRVEAVRDYYIRFMNELPAVKDLAQADEQTLLKLWQGLGYYNRIRNMHKAATVIEQDFGGVFPKTYEDIKALPGIGDYTAGAIASICFDKMCIRDRSAWIEIHYGNRLA